MAYNSILAGCNPDALAQIGAGPDSVPVRGTLRTHVPVDYIDPSIGACFWINADVATSTTLNMTSGGKLGQELTFVIEPDESGQLVVTFGNHLRTTGTATVAGGKCMVVKFVSDGTDFCELARTSAVV